MPGSPSIVARASSAAVAAARRPMWRRCGAASTPTNPVRVQTWGRSSPRLERSWRRPRRRPRCGPVGASGHERQGQTPRLERRSRARTRPVSRTRPPALGRPIRAADIRGRCSGRGRAPRPFPGRRRGRAPRRAVPHPAQGADRGRRSERRRHRRARSLAAAARIAFEAPPAEDSPLVGEDLPLAVVFEDEHLIVIDKPAGLVVHPAPGHAAGTLVNALIRRCGASLSGVGGVRRPGIVHRLDKDTSGLLVAAKTDAAHRGLAELFADHGRTGSLEREYLAIVWGGFDATAGKVAAPIGRDPGHRQRMAITAEERGRHAATHWRLEEALGPASLVACRLETGRTHQIRVHMASIGHPLLGDSVYGAGFKTKAALLDEAARSALAGLGRQALHASILGFEHPATGAPLRFESPPPEDFSHLLIALRAPRAA